jgi:hypothetical protein
MRGQRTWINGALAPLLPLMGAAVVGAMRIVYRRQVLGAPAPPRMGISPEVLATPTALAELPRIMMVGSSFMLAISILAVAYMVVPLTAFRAAGWLGRSRKWLLLAAAGVGLIAAARSAERHETLLLFNLLITDTLLQSIAEETASELGLGLSAVCDFGRLLDGLAIAVDCLLLTAVCCLVGPSDADGGSDGAESTLLRRTARLDVLLYVGTAMLLTHLFRMGALVSWCGAFFRPELQPSIGRIGEAVVAVDGIFFSLMVMAVYGPAAMILTRRAQTLARSQVDGAQRERQWLREHGFSVSLVDWLPRVGAALAPAISGGLRVTF